MRSTLPNIFRVFRQKFPKRNVFFRHICWILKKNQKVEEFLILFNDYFEKFKNVLSNILSVFPENNDHELVLFSLTFMYVGKILDFFDLSDVQQQWNECIFFFNIELFRIAREILQKQYKIITSGLSLIPMWSSCIDAIGSDTEIEPLGPEIFMRPSAQKVQHEQLLCSKCGALCADGLNTNLTDPFRFQGFCDDCFSH
jgi:hypothetical protein